MFGQTALGRANLSDSGNRMFRLEVEGLRQSDEADKLNYSIRQSGSVFVKVPYSRMSDEMQRISRLGGKIINVHPA